MPLIKSKSDKAFKKNISTEVKAGKPVKQAVAIAYSTKRAANKAYGGSVDDDGGYSRAGTSRNRLAGDARNYDSDIDYYNSLSGRDHDDDGEELPKRVVKARDRREDKALTRAWVASKLMDKAKKSGDKELEKKYDNRKTKIYLANKLENTPFDHPNSERKIVKARKEWSEKIGNGKPAPFKDGGKVKKSCW